MSDWSVWAPQEVQTERERLLSTEHADEAATECATQAAVAPILVVAKEVPPTLFS